MNASEGGGERHRDGRLQPNVATAAGGERVEPDGCAITRGVFAAAVPRYPRPPLVRLTPEGTWITCDL